MSGSTGPATAHRRCLLTPRTIQDGTLEDAADRGRPAVESLITGRHVRGRNTSELGHTPLQNSTEAKSSAHGVPRRTLLGSAVKRAPLPRPAEEPLSLFSVPTSIAQSSRLTAISRPGTAGSWTWEGAAGSPVKPCTGAKMLPAIKRLSQIPITLSMSFPPFPGAEPPQTSTRRLPVTGLSASDNSSGDDLESVPRALSDVMTSAGEDSLPSTARGIGIQDSNSFESWGFATGSSWFSDSDEDIGTRSRTSTASLGEVHPVLR